jgi:diphosphomevalonate decarboxylase
MNSNTVEKGIITWQSPSNIALVKYWGKRGNQLPRNPSLSMTLQASLTETALSYQRRKEPADGVKLTFAFEGKRNEAFETRVAGYLNRLLPDYQFLASCDLQIDSRNTFPHSSGIASSASAFSALALCVMSLKEISEGKSDEAGFYREASRLARLGSGSACRSVYGGYTIWGEVDKAPGYSDEYAVPLKSEIHEVFQSFYDAVLIVSGEKKKVGSSAGHSLMERHPFAQSRFRQAHEHTAELINVLSTGDLERYIEIVENEALTLHALMMSSSPGFMLMRKETIEIIERIRDFRKTENIPVSFTLDAGPNVHLLYPEKYRKETVKFIEDSLADLCAGRFWIDDAIGKGPEKIND